MGPGQDDENADDGDVDDDDVDDDDGDDDGGDDDDDVQAELVGPNTPPLRILLTQVKNMVVVAAAW